MVAFGEGGGSRNPSDAFQRKEHKTILFKVLHKSEQ